MSRAPARDEDPVQRAGISASTSRRARVSALRFVSCVVTGRQRVRESAGPHREPCVQRGDRAAERTARIGADLVPRRSGAQR
jgi:hypothetical protein